MSYTLVKTVHITAAILSISGFILRGYGVYSDAQWLRYRVTKILPHLIDSILFLSGLTLLIKAHFYPTQTPWMAVKLVAVTVYIVSGFFVLKWAKRKSHITIGFLLALSLLSYIVALAHFKNPLFFFHLF
jgi:uncharacterized membrane protein SirB2